MVAHYAATKDFETVSGEQVAKGNRLTFEDTNDEATKQYIEELVADGAIVPWEEAIKKGRRSGPPNPGTGRLGSGMKIRDGLGCYGNGYNKADLDRLGLTVEQYLASFSPRVESPFDGLGSFLEAVRSTSKGIAPPTLEEHSRAVSKSMTLVDPGAHLVPIEYSKTLLSVPIEESILFAGGARLWGMQHTTLHIPKFKWEGVRAEPEGTSAGIFGVRVRWTSEAAPKTEVPPEFESILMTAHKLVGFCVSSDELLADSMISLEEAIGTAFRESMKFYSDYFMLNAGTGTNQPQSYLNSPATVELASRSAPLAVDWEDIKAMSKRFYPAGWRNAVWVVSQSLRDQIYGLTALNPGAGTDVASPNWLELSKSDNVIRMLGAPVVFTEKTPAAGNKGDIMLLDPSQYAIGVRSTLGLEVNPWARFSSDQTEFRMVYRMDGRCTWDGTTTGYDGTEFGPCVVLPTQLT